MGPLKSYQVCAVPHLVFNKALLAVMRIYFNDLGKTTPFCKRAIGTLVIGGGGLRCAHITTWKWGCYFVRRYQV